MINVKENRRKMREYQKMTEEELKEIENDENISYNDYVLVCISRGLKNIETKETYTTEEVMAHVHQYIDMVAGSRN